MDENQPEVPIGKRLDERREQGSRSDVSKVGHTQRTYLTFLRSGTLQLASGSYLSTVGLVQVRLASATEGGEAAHCEQTVAGLS